MNALIQDEAGSEGASPLEPAAKPPLKSMERLIPTAAHDDLQADTSWVYPLES